MIDLESLEGFYESEAFKRAVAKRYEREMSQLIEETIEKYICLNHGVQKLHSKSREEKFCPFCENE